MKQSYEPYSCTYIDGKTYLDYSVEIQGVVYDLSVCEETQVLYIRRDEWQGKC